jgi:hypothetical protein
MKKKLQEKLLEQHRAALEEILEIWKNPQCLHTCRWGNKTVEICNDVLDPAVNKYTEINDLK